MKFSSFLIIACCLCSFTSFPYSEPTITLKEFENLIGCWEGSLTYLDYSSNKPFSMPANIVVKDFKKSNHIIYSISYPKEPNANSLDTIFISKEGRFLNKEAIKTKRQINKDSLELVTEIKSIDGNDNKPAIIRHTYILSNRTYTVKKEVQFTGQVQWILRNEYKFFRTRDCK
jgi:hypothetical protein